MKRPLNNAASQLPLTFLLALNLFDFEPLFFCWLIYLLSLEIAMRPLEGFFFLPKLFITVAFPCSKINRSFVSYMVAPRL